MKVTSARNDQHLLRMAVNDHTASSRQLAVHWSTATGVLMPSLLICRCLLHRGLRERLPLCRIPLTVNQRRLHLQRAHEHKAWQSDWNQVVFSEESRLNLWDHDGCIRVRRYAGERCLPECIIERHSGLTSGVMQDNAHPYVAKTVQDFCSAPHIQFLPWPAYSPDMSPIDHMWDLVSRRLVPDPRPAASKDELLLSIQAIWNSLSQADIQNLLDFMPL
ncbi:transposable element Tcb2 transposase [Trichonephila clavipes]|nr:transposable element Tcb2 transposase [Trichonephila clavipes]